VLSALLLATLLQASDSLAHLRVRVQHDGLPLRGARVRSGTIARVTDAQGLAILDVQPGAHTVVVTQLGFRPDTTRLTLTAGQDTSFVVALQRQASEIDRIVVSATRAERVVEDTPLRVEVVDEEEVAEKVIMTPGDVAMMMNETSGLRVATTSPSLGGANVRIQGLRGRYTLMLTDGLPLYGGQGSFGLLQIPPVDLARMEVIKGTASALYGPSALGGVINLLSRRPGDSARHELLLNQTTRGGSDVAYYGSSRLGESPLGVSLLASGHRQAETDIDGDGWADLAGYTRAVVRPRVFLDAQGRSLFATAGYTTEDRTGGTLPGSVAPDGQPYEEGLETERVDGGIVARVTLRERDVVSVRASATRLRHQHRFGSVTEDDEHRTAFGEASIALPRGRVTLVSGAAFQADGYENASVASFDFTHRVASAFAQIDLDAAAWLAFSGSARADDHNAFGASVSPRISMLLRSARLGPFARPSARFSVGTGTFAPVPLTEETEATGLSPVRVPSPLLRERAISGSMDVNGTAGPLEINATLYGSRLSDPLAVRDNAALLEVVNAPIQARTWGAEGLARWILADDLRVTAAYAFLRTSEWDPDGSPTARRDAPLAPRHTASIDLNYEQHGVSRFGLELYYTGRQALDDNPYRVTSLPYLVVGFLAERTIATRLGEMKLFINTENLGGVRQTRWDPLVRPSRGPGGRWTTDAWTELTGAVLNGGVRLVF